MRALGPDDPRQVGPFRITGVLGGGGMGRVYLGRSVEGRNVAVKTVRSELADDPHFRLRFGREVTAARQVRSPFVAAVVAAEPRDPAPWMATEYLPGLSLADAVREHGPLPERTVHLLVAGVVRALAAVHAQSLVHRDVKPSNVLLTAEGPRLIDFGIAHSAADTALTNTGMTLGTPGFMAPEQLISAGPSVTGATDVFALGGLVVHALTGSGPYGTAEPQVLMFRTVHEEPHLGEMAGPLRELAVACLAKDPGERPSPETLVERLGEPGGYDDWLPGPVTADLLRLSTRLLNEVSPDGEADSSAPEATSPSDSPAPEATSPPPAAPTPFDALPTGTARPAGPVVPLPPGPPGAPPGGSPSAEPSVTSPPTDATPAFLRRAGTPPGPGAPPPPGSGTPEGEPASPPGTPPGSGGRGPGRRAALIALGTAAVVGGGGTLTWALRSSGEGGSGGGADRKNAGAGTNGSGRAGAESPPADADPSGPPQGRFHNLLPRGIQERGSLVVASSLGYQPLGFRQGGEPAGVEVDLLHALAERFGVPVTFREGDYENLRALVQTGEADLAVSAQHDTKDGQVDFDYVDYFREGRSLVVPKGNPEDIRRATDLTGRRVAVSQDATEDAEYLRGLGGAGSESVELVFVSSFEDLPALVSQRRASAFLHDYSGATSLVTDYQGGDALEVGGSDFDDPALYGLVLPRGSTTLRTAVRKCLEDVISSGTYLSILKRWKVEGGAVDGVTINAGN